ncbi:serine hydrolase domain-containing protein [Ahniella affigens]|nr:serine hydrolase domain-containing protein [Ahniella affigens]
MQWNVVIRIAGALAIALAVQHVSACADKPNQSDGDAKRFSVQLDGWLTKTKVASASVAVVRDGRLAFVAAAGHASPERAASPETLYNVASLAKPLTAEMSLRLLHDRHWSLDEPLDTWWVDPDIADDPRAKQLTARILLSHQSGFPNWRDGRLAFAFAPGTRFGYSGEGYEYLARALAARAGSGFESLMTKTVLEPLGMRRTVQTKQPWLHDQFAIPYDAEGHPMPPQFARSASAADDLYTTATDYAQLILSAMQGSGISKSLSAARQDIQVDRLHDLCGDRAPSRCPSAAGFGLGWEIFKIGNQRYLMHTGRDTGTFALAYFSPERQTGVVILTNSDQGAAVVLPILDHLALDPAFTDWLRELASGP